MMVASIMGTPEAELISRRDRYYSIAVGAAASVFNLTCVVQKGGVVASLPVMALVVQQIARRAHNRQASGLAALLGFAVGVPVGAMLVHYAVDYPLVALAAALSLLLGLVHFWDLSRPIVVDSPEATKQTTKQGAEE